MTDDTPTPKQSWVKRVAGNAMLTVAARILLGVLLSVAGVILTYEITQAQAMTSVQSRTQQLEVAVQPIPDIQSKLVDLQNRMSLGEQRGTIAAKDRESQTNALSKIVEAQTGILQQLSALNQHLTDIDKRLDRMETKG